MDNLPNLPADHRRDKLVSSVKENIVLLLGAVALAWGLELFDTILLGFLDRFGIQPRSLSGLPGIVISPFLHLGFGHLISNTLPFLALGGIVLIGGRKVFFTATLFIIAVGGMALWTLGPSATNHVGASGLIFGYLGFLLARGIVEKSGFWIIVSIVTLVLYGGMLSGVLPGQPGISWQGHLFGFVSGILAARVMFTREKPLQGAG
ncbi:MAG: rhomboid family intramembrane serine protease [Verrucomicrobiales bacterium]|nr:rhomboid family intramembrane serine protease [Verrucomicrobiales bacterium]